MARPKYTYEQLLESHIKKTASLEFIRRDLREWRIRAKTAEKKNSEYIYIDKKPDYFFSVSGFSLFRRYYLSNGITSSQMEIMLMVSYVGTFFRNHAVIFKHTKIGLSAGLEDLIIMRYVTRVRLPAKNTFKTRLGFILTQRGKDLMTDYEKYYDKKMLEIRNKNVTQLTFEDGCYFRRTKIGLHIRRKEQGGGIVKRGTFNSRYSDNDEVTGTTEPGE
jgi:hypothetical protein